ncbi:MAG TPA: ATP-dependent sacrificial sulfur transferase LarE [Planctomycetota bacterium]|nr:ATP-dependent sacrificial sulfur transferase LarE [Planctomycetota bacterium]
MTALPPNILAAPPTAEACEKLAELERILRGYGRVIVAYSGGVDSAFLAVVANQTLGDKALAVTADSESLAPEELEDAKELATQFGVRHEVIRTDELKDENYASNPLNRCYFCKSELMSKLASFAKERNANAVVALGATMDDLGDFRPGEGAAKERGAVFPLREAGLTKIEIRALSLELGLPTWDKPGAACLSSRIPFGQRVTPEKLSQIARGEYYLHKAGFRECRLRHHDTIARVEVPIAMFAHVLEKRDEIVSALHALGFAHVTLDLQGLRSGSLTEVALKSNMGF